MKKHLVTVITPSLNQGQFIEQNILSVAEQTYPSIEHIVIDGGFTDGTIEILELLLNDYDLAKKIGKAGKRTGESLWSSKVIKPQWEKAFEEA